MKNQSKENCLNDKIKRFKFIHVDYMELFINELKNPIMIKTKWKDKISSSFRVISVIINDQIFPHIEEINDLIFHFSICV